MISEHQNGKEIGFIQHKEDKGYTFPGLTDNIKPNDAEVDYSKPPPEVRSRLVHSLTLTHGNLDVLSPTRLTRESTSEMYPPT